MSAADHRISQQDPDFIRSTFASIATRYDLANHALSGGADFLWRAQAANIVKSWCPNVVLDLATGSGDLALVLNRELPNAQVIAADFCEPMLREAQKKSVPNLIAADGTRLPFADAAFDALTVAFGLRNMADYDVALDQMARVIRPGGHVLVLDFSLPQSPILRTLYRAYLHHVLPRFAGGVTGQPEAYTYLGDSIEAFPRGSDMLNRLAEAGFELPAARPLWFGIVTIYTATRKR
ncbi:MAG: ubiquinone/menaquinone biosynthesis methyltransferase [Chthoniobacterales bacterium]